MAIGESYPHSLFAASLFATGSACYGAHMTIKALTEVMQRIDSWPEAAQEELAHIALEIEAGLKGEMYRASPEELAGIDRGLKAAREGRFATDKQVDAVFAKHRQT
jgi:predicted transcriptional regulator